MIPIPRALKGLLHTQTLVVAGWREALLADRPVVTLDDLLVGAAASGPLARALAAQGVSPDRLRDAVHQRDAEDLAAVGVRLPPAPPQRLHVVLPLAAERSVDLTPEARTFLGTTAVTEEALLVHLIDHASGAPARALELAGADVPALCAELVTASRTRRARRRAEAVPGLLDGLAQATSATERFVPVPAADLVRAVREPALVRRWLVVEEPDVQIGAAGELRWTVKGRPLEYRRVQEKADAAAPAAVTWQLFWPEDDGDPRGSYIRVEISPGIGGSAVRIVRGFRGMGRVGPVFARVGAWMQPLGARGLIAQLAGVAQDSRATPGA